MKLDLGLPKYMGRGIIFGLTTKYEPAVIYFVEGRSPSSKQRKLEVYPEENRVQVNINSETTLEKLKENGGNPDLLLYNAMRANDEGLIVVSNGFQTDRDPVWDGNELVGSKPSGGIYKRINSGYSHVKAIEESLRESRSEPDKYRTPRIAYVGNYKEEPDIHSFGIVVFDGDSDKVSALSRHLEKRGRFYVFATYGVHNPSYHDVKSPNIERLENWLKEIHLDGLTPCELIEEVWSGLPKEILVGVSSAMWNGKSFEFHVKNMRE